DENKPYRQGGRECLKQLSDGNFLIVGDRLIGDNSFEIFIIKMDNNGTILWETAFNSDHLQFARGVYELENGDLIINADGDLPFGPSNTEKAIIKTDEDGNLIWLQEYNDPYRISQQGNLEILPSGEMIMTYFAQPFGQNDEEPVVSKLDEEGNMLWSTKPYDQVDNLIPLANFSGKPLHNGNIMVMASRRYPEGIGALALALILLDADGNILEEKLLYTGGAAHILADMALTPEGDILISGEYEQVVQPDGSDFVSVPWLMKFSPDMELIWERFLVSEERGSNGIFWLEDMEVADDGSIVFGITTVEEEVVGTEASKVGVLILDADGCYVESCTSDLQFIVTDVADVLPLQDQVNLFPNPSSNILSLQISESVKGSIRLYDLSGRLMHQEIFSGSSYEATFPSFPNGIYCHIGGRIGEFALSRQVDNKEVRATN
ncbi:MAG: T9SS type A sorting domain-containing protein, partial [Saprospiraceae bacterium]